MQEAPDRLKPMIKLVENADVSIDGPRASSGDILQLTGARLAFDVADTEQGVFFVAEGGDAERASVYSRTGSVHVDCQLPQLAAGTYAVEVRARSGANDVLTRVAEDQLVVTG